MIQKLFFISSDIYSDKILSGIVDVLEEIIENENEILVYGDYKSYGTINKGLIELDIKPTKSQLKRIPNTPLELSEDQLVDIEKMLDKMEDDEDVQFVFTNIS